jgi:hypothetical protein
MATSTEIVEEPKIVAGKRLNLKLSPSAYRDLKELSRLGAGQSMTEIFRLALSLLKTVYPAVAKGEQLYLVNPSDNTERQIVLPT